MPARHVRNVGMSLRNWLLANGYILPSMAQLQAGAAQLGQQVDPSVLAVAQQQGEGDGDGDDGDGDGGDGDNGDGDGDGDGDDGDDDGGDDGGGFLVPAHNSLLCLMRRTSGGWRPYSLAFPTFPRRRATVP